MILEKILQSQGFGSRKFCRNLIRDGRVSINGTIFNNPDTEVETEKLEFEVDHTIWIYRQRIYIAMNKPAGFECSHQSQHHPGIFSFFPPQLINRGLQCAGRLDQDTTGLLLFSDDGLFIHTMISPRKNIPKVYEAQVRHALLTGQIDALMAGVFLHGEKSPVQALSCQMINEKQLRLAISEGKYHQVKRMVAAIGNRVERLHRISIGNLVLEKTLAEGSWRYLEEADLIQLGYAVP